MQKPHWASLCRRTGNPSHENVFAISKDTCFTQSSFKTITVRHMRTPHTERLRQKADIVNKLARIMQICQR